MAAGVNPTNGTFGDGDDLLTGGSASGILSAYFRGPVDAGSRLLAGDFGKVRISGEPALDLATDARFVLLT